MWHRLCFALALTFAALLPQTASARYLAPQCQALDDRIAAEDAANVYDAVIEAAAAECEAVAMGIVPLEQRAAQGDRVLRAGIWHGERSVPVFVEYVRPRTGQPWLAVRAPWEGLPHRIVRISNTQFSAVWSRWRAQPHFVAAGGIADAALKAAETAHGETVVCIAPWSGTTVEIADKGRAETVKLDPCKSGEYAFSRFLVRQARRDIGRCAEPRRPDPGDADRLLACLPDS